MTEQELLKLLQAASQLLRPHLEKSPPLREFVGLLGQWLVDEARSEPAAVADLDQSSAIESQSATGVEPASVAAAALSAVPPRPGAYVPLRLGDAAINIQVPGTTEEIGRARLANASIFPADSVAAAGLDGPRLDLRLVSERCRLKAQACEVFIQRRAASGDMVREQPLVNRVSELIAQAKSLPQCFLWMLFRDRPQPDDETLDLIARCYEALAAAAQHMSNVDQPSAAVELPHDTIAHAMQLLAEAGSGLRVALEKSWLTAPDADQADVHLWLRHESLHRQIFLPRYMKLDDPANPLEVDDLGQAVEDAAAEVAARQASSKAIGEAFKQIRYHAARLNGQDDGEREYHAQKIAVTLERLDQLGLEPDHPRIVESLASVADPEFWPPRMDSQMAQEALLAVRAAVAAAAVRSLAASSDGKSQGPTNGRGGTEQVRQWSPRVLELRTLLAGRTIVMIGGEHRSVQADRIKEAFNLRELIWVRLTEHGSGEAMRAPIARAETALVVVIIKLAGHLHADEARSYARAAGKPYVMMTAGYNPEQIAEAVSQQALLQLTEAGQTIGA